MERFKSAFVTLDSFFQQWHFQLPLPLRERLQDITGGKACLLCELPHDAVLRLDLEFPGTLGELQRLIQVALLTVGASSDPLRYVQAGTHAIAHLPGSRPFQVSAELSRPPSWTWVEVAAAQGPLASPHFSEAMDLIFEEAKHLRRGHHSFRERLTHSGCSYFLPAYMPDDPANEASWDGPPRKRLKSMASELHRSGRDSFIDPSKWRFPGLLAREAALRTSCRSIMASWKCYRSGIRAWGEWVNFRFPFCDPFSVSTEMICTFSTAFHMASTFKEYWGHVRFAVRLLGLPFLHLEHTVQQLLRGCRKGRRKRELLSLRLPDVKALVLRSVSDQMLAAARFFVCARAGLFRVMNELLPLQADGRKHLPSDSQAWHSFVRFTDDTVEVHLRTRKCHPLGDVIRRRCSCRKSSDVFCMFHALQAQVGLASSAHQPIWPFSKSEIIRVFKALLHAVGLPINTGFHAFRRGMARDLLAKGEELSVILRAGGWRSSAFLNYLTTSGVEEREALDFSFAESDSE